MCTASGNQTKPAVASDGSSGAIVAWVDSRGADPDIYVQRVMSNGTIAQGWPANGVPVCTASGNQDQVQITADGSGGAIVVWRDGRGPTTDIYASRVTASGTISTTWPANGLVVCAATGSQSNPVLTRDSGHGAMIAWEDLRGLGLDIYAMRMLEGGTIDPAWTVNGRQICGAHADQRNPKIVPGLNGSAIIVWQDWRGVGGGNAGADILAQRVSQSGVNQWYVNGVIVSVAHSSQELPAIASDGAGGAFVSWTDYRSDVDTDIYAQHLGTNGAPVAGWQSDGNPICVAVGTQLMSRIVSDGAGGAYVAWRDGRGEDDDIYIQRVLGDGTLPNGWRPDGVDVCGADSAQTDPALVTDGAGGALVLWRDARIDTASDVYGQHLLPSGATAEGWAQDGVKLANAEGMQTDLAAVADSAGTAIAAWSDYRSTSGSDVYAQQLGPGSVLAVPSGGGSGPAITRAFPNPAFMRTRIAFAVTQPGRVRCSIYDASGRLVRALDDESHAAGRHEIEWDGRTSSGRRAPTGTYLVKIASADGVRTTRVTIAR